MEPPIIVSLRNRVEPANTLFTEGSIAALRVVISGKVAAVSGSKSVKNSFPPNEYMFLTLKLFISDACVVDSESAIFHILVLPKTVSPPYNSTSLKETSKPPLRTRLPFISILLASILLLTVRFSITALSPRLPPLNIKSPRTVKFSETSKDAFSETSRSTSKLPSTCILTLCIAMVEADISN